MGLEMMDALTELSLKSRINRLKSTIRIDAVCCRAETDDYDSAEAFGELTALEAELAALREKSKAEND